jgi:sugar (pentulose or hexulose) kinase
MGGEYLLGIDNGTTVIKAALFDLEGKEIAVGRGHEVAVAHPKSDQAEESMEEIWQATVEAIGACLQSAEIKPELIAGVSLSGHGGGVYLLDKAGKPVHEAMIWLDGRAAPYLEKWSAEGIMDEIYDSGGWSVFPGIGPCTIFPWLLDNEPATLEAAAVNLTSKDWVKYRLTGELSTDRTMASIGHMDYTTGGYSDRILELCGIDEWRHLFPPIMKSWEVAGTISKTAAEATGLMEGTPVAAGAWDGTSSTLGSGCIEVGEAASVIGTAGVHVAVSGQPDLDPDRNYSLMYHTVPDRYVKNSLPMLAIGNLNWFEREILLPEREEAERSGRNLYELIYEMAAGIAVGSGGILYLPFLQGERAPFVKPEARGVYFGLTDWHTRAHMLRALLEGVALSTKDSYACMQKGGGLLERAYLTGGGSRSPVLRQMLADATGAIMLVPVGSELGARGAAINAGVAVGLFSDHAEAVERMVQIEAEYTPNEGLTERYDELFVLYKDLIQAVWGVWEQSAKLGAASWS